MKSIKVYFRKFLYFWIFLILFKFGASLHYDLMAPLGERVLSVWLVGVAIGGASLLQLFFDVPAGFLLDKFGYRKLLKLTAIFFMFSALSLCFGLSIFTYIVTLGLGCFGWLFFGPGTNAYLLSHAPKESASIFISFRDTFESFGVLFSGMIFSLILPLDVKLIGFIIFFLIFISLIFIWFSPKDIESVHSEKKIETQHYYIKRQYLIHILKTFNRLNPASFMLVLTGLASSIFYALIWFVVPLIIAHDSSYKFLNFGLGVFDLAIVCLGFVLGKIAEKFNRRKLVFFGLLIFALAGIFIGFNFGLLFLILGFLATTGDELTGISLWSWLNILDKDHKDDGLIAGVISLFQDLGWAIGPAVAGVLYEFVGPSWTIAVGGIFIFSVWSIYSIFLKRLHKEHGEIEMPKIKKPHKFRHKR